MNGASHLLPRNGTYYFHRRVPDFVINLFAGLTEDQQRDISPEIVAYFKGKKFIRLSLRNKDKKKAVPLCIEQDFKFSSYVAKLEQLAATGTPVFDTASPETIKGLAQTWLARALEADEEQRIAGVSHGELEASELGSSYLEDDLRESVIGTGGSKLAPSVTKAADALLAEFQINLDRKSSQYDLLHRELIKAFLHLFQAQRGRNKGMVVDTPAAPPEASLKAPSGLQGGVTLDGCLEYWKGLAARRDKSSYDMQNSIDEFKALHGDITIDKITKTQVVAYKDWLLGIGLPEGVQKKRAASTIEKRITMLKALLQVAVDNDKLPFNPCQGVGLPKEKVTKKARVSFTQEDLTSIFSGPVHTGGTVEKGAAGKAGYWMPLMALYMGIREGEAAQITKEDVKHKDGIDYILVINEEEDQQLKTESSKRRVPLHPDLIKLGFLEFVKAVSKGERLFPLVVKYREQWAKAWGQWFGRYLRKEPIGITDSRKVFHSFRHTFKDLCRSAGISEEVHDALTGHSNGGVGRMYGGENFPLEPLAAAIKKIKVGVKLKKIS